MLYASPRRTGPCRGALACFVAIASELKIAFTVVPSPVAMLNAPSPSWESALTLASAASPHVYEVPLLLPVPVDDSVWFVAARDYAGDGELKRGLGYYFRALATSPRHWEALPWARSRVAGLAPNAQAAVELAPKVSLGRRGSAASPA